jgi:HAD superfamily hydrolase (TIGR01484 family)
VKERLPAEKIRAVFSDLDDTLTSRGFLSAETHDALEKLISKGLWVVIVSGRPAGWADCLMRLLPLHAMIFENGAGVMVREGEKIQTILLSREKDFTEQKLHLEKIYQDLKKKFPTLKLATDQPYRLCDYALDYAEEEPFLSNSQVTELMQELERRPEITAKLSSIHINYWYGKHTKVTACEFLLEKFGKTKAIARENVLFSGDSPNDEPLFEYFEHSVGVANVAKFLDRMKFKPKYVTEKPGGEGFVEMSLQLTSPR